jgi:hypothetical protein
VVTLGRTFSSDPNEVIAHARAFITGMHAAGVLTTLKHFPGHGSSRVDSHHGFTDVSDTAAPGAELAPYRALISEGLADSIMPAHVFNRRLTLAPRVAVPPDGDPPPPAPATGLVVSDDLLRARYPALRARGRRSAAAGADVPSSRNTHAPPARRRTRGHGLGQAPPSDDFTPDGDGRARSRRGLAPAPVQPGLFVKDVPKPNGATPAAGWVGPRPRPPDGAEAFPAAPAPVLSGRHDGHPTPTRLPPCHPFARRVRVHE